MESKFKKLSLEQLHQAIENLIYRLLQLREEDNNVDIDDLCSELEDFAGRDYIIWTKLHNELPLLQSDNDYLSELLSKNANTIEL